MKKYIKYFFLLCGMLTMQVSADTGSQDEIQVSVITNKENYQDGETVHVSVEITNRKLNLLYK